MRVKNVSLMLLLPNFTTIHTTQNNFRKKMNQTFGLTLLYRPKNVIVASDKEFPLASVLVKNPIELK